MRRLRPISPETSSPSLEELRTEPASVATLLPLPSVSTSGAKSTNLSKLPPIACSTQGRILDFDMESVAVGFADPAWVPQKITCVAWGWTDEERVEVRTCGVFGIYGLPQLRSRMLEPLLAAIDEATMVTGHNLFRHDLPLLRSECWRLGLDPPKSILVQDTIKLGKHKGFKKGQDNLEALYKTDEQKLQLNWQEWDDAYQEVGWPTVRARCRSDVVGHRQLRRKLEAEGKLGSAIWWVE